MTIAEYIADQLFKAGVRFVFGLPGGPSIPYIAAFRSAGIEFILVSNESSAAVMADVTARLTGLPGVCHSTFGPGATNISTGVGGSLLDRSPLLVFTSEVPDNQLGRTVQMNINHQLLFKPITKRTFRVNPENIKSVLESALQICLDEYPGPVHIGLPSDIAAVEINYEDIALSFREDVSHENDIASVINLLDKSRHPLIAIGHTAARSGAGTLLLEFLKEFRIPVVLTPMAKGIIPENHQCYAGVLFHALSDYLEDIYEKTDLVIGLGYDQVEYNYESWIPDVPLIHFNTIKTDLPELSKIVSYIGGPDDWFRLLRNLNQGSLVFEKAIVESVRNEMLSVMNGFLSHFGPVTALKVLKDELPAESVITADVGSHLHLIGQYWNTPSTDSLIMTNGWSSMGFGLPAALAVQLVRPEATVVCITGDGGFLMTAGEMITALRYKLPVIVVVFSDGELNLIKLKQSWRGVQPAGTDLYSGDLFMADRFMGVKVINADSEQSMRKAVNIALSLEEPVIINAMIDPEDYKWLVVKPE
jgi:acetolactate synthase I/II/III large subunit